MSVRVFYDILNQKGTPAMYTDTLANRPTYGYQGRLFISTDSGQIFEDTGSAWTLVADAGVGGGTLSSVCLNGNTTATGIVITAGGLSSNSITNTENTAGSVLFAGTSGLESQSNATFFWDNTNKRLGIGNASPGAPLDIHGTGTQIQANGTGSSNSYIQFQNAGVNKWRIGNTYNGAANTFDLYNNSLTSTALSFNVTTNAATFNNSITATSVAISGGTSAQFLKADGTTDSNTYLTTSSASSTYLPLAGGTLTGALSGTSITGTSLVKSGGTSAQILAADGSVITAGTNITISGGTIAASGGGGSMAIGGTITSATAGSVLFAGASGVLAQSNATFFWDNTNKYLGIGTTAPNAGVTSYSTTSAAQFKAAGTSAGITFSDTVASPTYSCALGIATATNNFVTGTAIGDMGIVNQSTTPGAIVFGIGSANEKARISNTGSFGIGTSTIGSKLQVNGNAAIGYSSSTAAPTNGLMVAGNVGIGVTPSAWGSGITVLQIGTAASLWNRTSDNLLVLASNSYFNGTVDVQITTGTSNRIYFVSGTIYFDRAASTAAGSTTPWVTSMTISPSGAVYIANLAGTGSRAVVADASGVLSAPVSDVSVKQNITTIGYGLKEISKMNPIWFDFIDEYKNYGEGRQNGNIAQEMEAIIPEAVFTTPSTGKMGINYDQLHAVYIKAIQELKAEIDELKIK